MRSFVLTLLACCHRLCGVERQPVPPGSVSAFPAYVVQSAFEAGSWSDSLLLLCCRCKRSAPRHARSSLATYGDCASTLLGMLFIVGFKLHSYSAMVPSLEKRPEPNSSRMASTNGSHSHIRSASWVSRLGQSHHFSRGTFSGLAMVWTGCGCRRHVRSVPSSNARLTS